ncbi:hypothetical protein ACFO0M_03090 [Micromonospora mangrovi]
MRYQLRYVRVPPVFVGDGRTVPDDKIGAPPGPGGDPGGRDHLR